MRLYQNKYPISDEAEYVIDYIFDDDNREGSYQLVRLRDDAILCAYVRTEDVFMHCWRYGISYNKVAII